MKEQKKEGRGRIRGVTRAERGGERKKKTWGKRGDKAGERKKKG